MTKVRTDLKKYYRNNDQWLKMCRSHENWKNNIVEIQCIKQYGENMTFIKLSSIIQSRETATELFHKWKKDTPDLFVVVKELKRHDRPNSDHQYYICRPIRDTDKADLDRGREGKDASLYLEMKDGMSIIYPEEVKKKTR